LIHCSRAKVIEDNYFNTPLQLNKLS